MKTKKEVFAFVISASLFAALGSTFGDDSYSASNPIEVQGASEISAELLARLRRTLDGSIEAYERFFPRIQGPISVRIGSASDALRTGYRYGEGSLHFPEIRMVKEKGLDSVDVIRHELFHLLACRGFPAVCPADLASRPDMVSVHEALADYFAFVLAPDSGFGEDYYVDKPFIRSYRNDLRLSLVEGAHAQGNAITKYLIQFQIRWPQIRALLETGQISQERLATLSPDMQRELKLDSSLRMDEELTNSSYPYSRLRRYRLKKDRPLAIRFKPNSPLLENFPGLRVAWLTEDRTPPKYFDIQEFGGLQYEIRSRPGAKTEKLLAVFFSEDRMIGFRAFYFGPDL